MNVIDSKDGERNAGGKPVAAFPHSALDGLYFVGGFHAHRRMATILGGFAHLLTSPQLSGATRLVVDTGGSVATLGLQLKRLKIDALRPDHIIVIGDDPELAGFLAACPPDRLSRLPAHPDALPPSAMTRGLMRLQAFEHVFAEATPHVLRDIIVEPWDEHAFDWTNGAFICALADAQGHDLGLGMLAHVEADGAIHVMTAVEIGRVRRMRVGMPLPEELEALIV